MRTLRPQQLCDKDFSPLESEVNAILWEVVYGPIVALVKQLLPREGRSELPELQNASDTAFRAALQSGKIQMVVKEGMANFVIAGGQSKREWTDSMKAFGAKFNQTTKTFTCKLSEVPSWVREEAKEYTVKAKVAHDQVKKLLDDLKKKVDRKVDEADASKGSKHAVDAVDDGWKKAARGLEVIPDVGADGRKTLAAEFERTAKIPIKDLSKELIERLREQVDENAMQGFRAEGLAKKIREEYGVSLSRANLIARQETSNFMANFRKARAIDAGCKRYVWRAVMDARTRKTHREHNGRTFRYDDPPIVDPVTGQRANPGEHFRCRCVDLPILEAA
jgi:SPP1 gp7 family putative phage head morphogenesis protein